MHAIERQMQRKPTQTIVWEQSRARGNMRSAIPPVDQLLGWGSDHSTDTSRLRCHPELISGGWPASRAAVRAWDYSQIARYSGRCIPHALIRTRATEKDFSDAFLRRSLSWRVTAHCTGHLSVFSYHDAQVYKARQEKMTAQTEKQVSVYNGSLPCLLL